MAINNVELMKQTLVDLNKRIGEIEQKQGEEAHLFFTTLLSEQLIFRRANGMVVGKSEPKDESVLGSLAKPSPFKSRESEDISVKLLDNRALVTLIVVGTRHDDSVARYRNIRLFSRSGDNWILELWYNYEISA